jgi:uncharacterized protein (DUF934 family)
MTINELMVLMTAVKTRVAELREVRRTSANRETWYNGTNERNITPEYDVKKVDKKIVELQNFLRKADAKLKQTNATTNVQLEVDEESLLSPLE